MSGECILVIDDSKEIVKHLTERVLPSYGYETLHAYDGQSGLKLIREKKPNLVMLDFNLPEMTGLDVLQKLAQESMNTPVVLMTGYGSELSAIEAFRLGAKDYLIKPFTVEEIIETIDRALVETRLLHDKQELAEQLRRVKVEMSRQTSEMKTLSNIGKAITSLLSVDQVLERVLEAATYLTNAEESTIWLPDASNTRLHAYEKRGNGQTSVPLPDLSMADSQVGQVMHAGEPLRDAVFSGQGIKVKTGYFARAVLYVPLKLRNVTLGVLGVSNRTAPRSFSKRDEFLLSFLADYAAIALENARVFQATDQALALHLEELNTLIDITRTITSSLNLDEVVRLTIQQVHDGWNIEASSLWLLDEAKQSLRVLANVGTPNDLLMQLEVPLGKGFVGDVAKTGKWLYTNDAASHPQHYRLIDTKTGFKTRSLLCVPIMFRGKVVGAMELLNKRDGGFDDQDVERALSIAAAVAIAVTNALLYKESEARKQHLEATLEHNNSPILITDADNNLLLLNQEARRRLQLTNQTIGQPVADVLQPPELAEAVGRPATEGQGELALPDGSIWLPRVAPIPGHGRILILQDITNLRQLDKAKDRFMESISEDMRVPLDTISDYVASLGQTGSLNEAQNVIVSRILQANEQMMAMVSDLLELAKINTRLEQGYEACDVLEIVADVIHEFKEHALAQRVALVLTTEKEIKPVHGNREQLRCAISHLVDNAIKYSPENRKVQVTVVFEADNVLVMVRDEGKGISEVDLPHIFDKFYRGQNNSSTAGTGLGLALVEAISRAHGGRVWAESSANDGSAFFLQLPTLPL